MNRREGAAPVAEAERELGMRLRSKRKNEARILKSIDFIGRSPNVVLGLSCNYRNILFLELFLDKTVPAL